MALAMEAYAKDNIHLGNATNDGWKYILYFISFIDWVFNLNKLLNKILYVQMNRKQEIEVLKNICSLFI